jgi:UDP-N-acetylglucosamine acyltransferase
LSLIHPTAVVAPGAKIAEDATVGPHSVIDGEVELGPGVEIGPQVWVTGRTRIGARTAIYPHSVIGAAPQILNPDRFGGTLEIGEDNEIREFASIHVGSPDGGGRTVVGNHNLIQGYFHVAHDCLIGSHCVLAGQAGLGGHVVVGDYAVIGARTAVHQFVRIGESAFTAGNSMVSQDVVPFTKVAGDRAKFIGINTINLERRGFDKERIAVIKHALHLLFNSKLGKAEALERIEGECAGAEVERLLGFLRSAERGFTR